MAWKTDTRSPTIGECLDQQNLQATCAGRGGPRCCLDSSHYRGDFSVCDILKLISRVWASSSIFWDYY